MTQPQPARRWTCPDCRSTYAVPGTDPQKARCSKCRDVLARVWNQAIPIASPPPLKPKPAPVPATVWRPVTRPLLAALSQDACLEVMIVGLLVWFLFAFAPPGWDLFSYLGLIAAVAAGTLWRLRRTPKRPRLIVGAGVCVGLVALATFGWNDTYEREIFEDDFVSTVTFTRWGDTPVYEHMLARTVDAPFAWAEGPLSSSGRKHGCWRMRIAGAPRSGDLWFWYGDLVTEGEWHRRDR